MGRIIVKSVLLNYISLAHINLLHQGCAEFVDFLVKGFLLAFVERVKFTAMLLEEVGKHVLREQSHDFAEVFRKMNFADVAHHVGETVLRDVCLSFNNQHFQFITERNWLGKELIAFLHALFLCETLVLVLDENPRTISEVARHHRTYYHTLTDVVVNGRQPEPFGDFALKSVWLLQTVVERTTEQGLCIEETQSYYYLTMRKAKVNPYLNLKSL